MGIPDFGFISVTYEIRPCVDGECKLIVKTEIFADPIIDVEVITATIAVFEQAVGSGALLDVISVTLAENFPNAEVSEEVEVSIIYASDAPTDSPSNVPSDSPSNAPIDVPITSPSDGPTDSPSDGPTDSPSDSPAPTITTQPTTTFFPTTFVPTVTDNPSSSTSITFQPTVTGTPTTWLPTVSWLPTKV